MADMQIAVGLGRKARDDAAMATRCEVAIDNAADEIGNNGLTAHAGFYRCDAVNKQAADFTRKPRLRLHA
jgi:hypothetical protein